MTQPVFVGYDTREDIAFQVCEYSIKRFNPEICVTLWYKMSYVKKRFIGEKLIS